MTKIAASRLQPEFLQNSNPLPEPRIYERGHEHSRSWNVESVHGMSPSPPQENDYQYYQVVSLNILLVSVYLFIYLLFAIYHVVAVNCSGKT